MAINDLFISAAQIIVTAVLTAYTTAKVNEARIQSIKEEISEIKHNIKEISNRVINNELKIAKLEEKFNAIVD